MSDTNSQKFIQIPVTQVSAEDLIRNLSEERLQLHQIIDEMANTLAMQKELIQQLKDEIARLKGQKPKPDIKPSKLEGQNRKSDWRKRICPHNGQVKTILFPFWGYAKNFNRLSLNVSFSVIATEAFSLQTRLLYISRLARLIIKKNKRLGKPGQPKGKPRKKKTVLHIHQAPIIHPINIPEGAVFKGFKRYTVQDIIFEPHNTQYQLGRWMLPDGSYISGELPKNVNGHYGSELIAYILHQYYACRVTEHLLLDQLWARGILISAGQLNNILLINKNAFIEEVAELLPVGIQAQGQVQTDDTGGRHMGRNQYTTVIGNSLFSIFSTTESKSKINFLQLLQGGKQEYRINEDTLDYLKQKKLPGSFLDSIALHLGREFTSLSYWKHFLEECSISRKIEVRFLTEAALYASLIARGISRNLGVHSDDAGQFDVFVHSLCWIHEERHYRKLIMTTDEAQIDLDRVINQIWAIYQDLKSYKESPDEASREHIENKFDEIFQQKTSSTILNHQLKKTHKKKQELLRVLERPETPLHNNSSETDARSAKIKLKISGGTRSDEGRKIRDIFLSLQQTCLKLGINFIDFLRDRARGLYAIPRLAMIIRERILKVTSDPPDISFLRLKIQSIFDEIIRSIQAEQSA
jgi:hypothetical protein